MSDLHSAIARGLATELRAFCEPAGYLGIQGDWFRWTWDFQHVDVQLFDGRILILPVPPSGHAGDLPPKIAPILECDLADPRLIELLVEKLRLP